MNLAQQHRQALCDAAQAAGPDAPTLCQGWMVRDLLAHVVTRDSRPDATVGMVLSVATPHTEAVHESLATLPFHALLDRARSGPPRWSPARWPRIDDAINVAEFVVHREDIVRAGLAWPGESTEPERQTDAAAWSSVRRIGRLLYRRSPTGVVVRVPGVGRAVMRRPPRGRGTVVLTGQPVELLLHAFGRTEHARVEVSGAPSDVGDVAPFTQTHTEV